jgi:hypothetical protein
MTTLWPLTALFGEERASAPGPQLAAYDDAELEAAFAALVPGAIVPELAPATETEADVDAAFAALLHAASA